MRSFASIATFATLAFASVASALPVISTVHTLGAIDTPTEVATGAHNIVPELNPRVVLDGSTIDVPADIEARHGQLSVVEILSQATTTVTPLCKNLTDTVSAQNVDVDTILPIVLDVLGHILGVVTQAKSDILASISAGVTPLVLDGNVLDLKAVAQLVCALIVTIIKCLGLVCKVVGGVHGDVLALVGNIGSILGELLSLVLPVAGGLLAVLLPIIQPVVPTILALGLNTVAGVLTLV